MRLRALLLLLVFLVLLGCSRAIKGSYIPAQHLPEITKPHTQAIEPSIDMSISEAKQPEDNMPEKHPEEYVKYDFSFGMNPKIEWWIQRLNGPNQNYFQESLYEFDRVRPFMEEIFENHGVPKDLVYLSFVESGGKPHAISSAGATGYWQFMPGTARRYGLQINSWIDERRDLHKSTEAAARYLKHLHSLFNDWLLASAAYNAGEGTIIRLIRQYPKIDGFWDISDRMPIKRETLAYVPKFVATLVMAKNREEYELNGPKSEEYPNSFYGTVTVHSFTYLDEIAEIAGVSETSITDMNPELIRGCTPPTVKEYRLKIPKETTEVVSAYLTRIHDPKVEYTPHTINKGDTLLLLAKRYSSTTRNIAQTNRMGINDILRIGQVLIIPVNKTYDEPRRKHLYVVTKGDTIKSISKMHGVSVQDIIDVNPIENPELIYPSMVLKIPPKRKTASSTRHIQYRVKKGDTIWGISKQFEVSASDVMRWNQLSPTAQIYPGDELTIYYR